MLFDKCHFPTIAVAYSFPVLASIYSWIEVSAVEIWSPTSNTPDLTPYFPVIIEALVGVQTE